MSCDILTCISFKTIKLMRGTRGGHPLENKHIKAKLHVPKRGLIQPPPPPQPPPERTKLSPWEKLFLGPLICHKSTGNFSFWI